MQKRILGPYELTQVIGAGRLATVYTGRVVGAGGALPRDRPVIVKLLSSSVFDGLDVAAPFAEEGRLARQVRHAGVVRTYDVGIRTDGDTTEPYLVMETVGGATLRALQDELGVVPEPLLRTLALELAGALAAIHAVEILHLDVSPENVLIDHDGGLRVMDLGVAAVRRALLANVADGRFAPSVAYAAPETFLGGPVGPAADLYSLGVLLYELATGEHPFQESDVSGFVRAHVEDRPRRADRRNPRVSPFLAHLLVSLLEKDPARRPTSAASLHALLVGCEASGWWLEHERDMAVDHAAAQRVPLHADTRLVGRDGAFARLLDGVERARRGRGSALLVEGGAGVGKTRLVAELQASLGPEEAYLLYGAYSPGGESGGIARAVAGFFGQGGLAEGLTHHLGAKPDLARGLTSMLLRDDAGRSGRPLRDEALHAALVDLMKGLGRQRPVVWVVDDLHFAPAESRALILSLIRAIAGRPVLLVLTRRPTGARSPSAWRDGLEDVGRIPLGPLPDDALRALLEDATGSPVLARGLLPVLARPSGGVPFPALEMVKELEIQGVLKRGADGALEQAAPFETVELPDPEGLIERRLAALEPADRALFDAGALQGNRFEASLLAAMAGEKQLVTELRLARLERRIGLLEGAGSRWRFSHALVFEAVERTVPAEVARELHTSLARALMAREGLGGERSPKVGGPVSRRLARHHLAGTAPLEARPFVVAALDYLWGSHENREAAAMAQTALDVPELLDARRRLDVLVRLARSLEELGRRDEQGEALAAACKQVDELNDPPARVRILRLAGVQAAGVRDHERALTLFEEAYAAANDLGDRFLVAQLDGDLGKSYRWIGEFVKAQGHLERFLNVVRETGDLKRQAQTVYELARVAYRLGNLKVSRAHHEKALFLMRAAEDRGGVVRVLNGMSTVLLRLGEYDEARACLIEYLDLTRALGLRAEELFGLTNLAALHMFLGEPARSREHLAEHLELAREVGDRRQEAVALANLGAACVMLGDLDAAQEPFVKSLAAFRDLGLPKWEAFVLNELGRVEEAAGVLAEAKLRYREALTLLRTAGAEGEVAAALIAIGRVAAAEGRNDDAKWNFEEAYVLAREFDAASEQVLASAYLCLIGALDANTVLGRLVEHRVHMRFRDRMESAFVLWRATSAPEQLEDAHNLLTSFRDKVPEAERKALIDAVPLHRAIEDAWSEHTAAGAD